MKTWLMTVFGMVTMAMAAAQAQPVSVNPSGGGSTPLPILATGTPVFISANQAMILVGASFTYQLAATNSPVSYNATGLPAGLSFTPSSGVISGKPTATGRFFIALSATNPAGTGRATLTLTVYSTPAITSKLSASGSVGFNFYYQIVGTNQPASYNASNLPAGLSINTVTGTITGKPRSTGTVPVTITATNPAGSATATLSITVANPPPPVISSSLTASGSAGANFSYQISATNLPTSYNAAGLSAGLSINPVTGTITGTTGVVGKFNITLSATNAGGTGTAVLNLGVTSAPAIVVQPRSQIVIIGGAATLSVTAAGATSYQWQFNGAPISGAIRSALTLTKVKTTDAGNYTVMVSNAAGSVSSSVARLTAVVGIPGVLAGVNAVSASTQPATVLVAPGATAVLSATTGDAAQLSPSGPTGSAAAPDTTYQWQLDAVPIAGATRARLMISNAGTADAGTYTCIVTNAGTPTATSPVDLALSSTDDVGRLVNFSVLTGMQGALTMGFVVGGAGTDGAENLLIRAIGPALTGFGLNQVLPDPAFTASDAGNGALVAANSGWGSNQAQVQLADAATGAFPLVNPSSRDAAVVVPLPVNPAGYILQVAGQGAGSGSALSEVYDYTSSYTPTTPRLINFSCLAPVVSGGTLTAGFVIGGSTAKTFLLRATGPALAQLGVGGVIPDPKLLVQRASSAAAVASNAAWRGDPQITAAGNSVGAFPLANPLSLDSAVLVTLSPGAYSVQVSSASGAAGTVLVEVYEVP